VAWAQGFGNADGGGDVDAGGGANRQALVDEDVVDLLKRFGVRDAQGIVDLDVFQVGGNAGLADALGDGRAGDGEVVAFYPTVEAAASGSANTIRMLGLRAFKASETPPRVPPVPQAQVKASIRPSVCCQISSPVVAR
jgi:hypothetical protein